MNVVKTFPEQDPDLTSNHDRDPDLIYDNFIRFIAKWVFGFYKY